MEVTIPSTPNNRATKHLDDCRIKLISIIPLFVRIERMSLTKDRNTTYDRFALTVDEMMPCFFPAGRNQSMG